VNDNPGNVQPHKCAKEECTKTYMDHHWGTKEAQREGWFMQRNGDSWCPDHVPDWVEAWREKKRNQEPKPRRTTKNIIETFKDLPK
jgi:hypothetical protein